ncbi:MAG TPA: GTP-binding protein [Clostridiaceae bacterium]|nr:GTP-binding protein [Clostridiaceae bacterium]
MNKRLNIALSALLLVVVIASCAVIIGTVIRRNKSNDEGIRGENGTQNSQNESVETRDSNNSKNDQVNSETAQETGDDNGQDNSSSDKGSDSGDNLNGQKDDNQKNDKFKDIKVRALYLTGTSAGSKEMLERIINLAKTTELNAVVIDVKEAGKVNYKSDILEVRNNNLFVEYYDPDYVIKKLHDNDIYVIGRIVCFRDDGLARKRADLAVKKPDGSIWYEGKMGAWTNPYSKEVWEYNVKIAKEAIEKGFDEIQFDYVRFPATRKGEVFYGNNLPTRVDAICGFLEYSVSELKKEKDIVISADIFGIVCESIPDGEAIGQDLERIGMAIDYICPMVYPSHYANASNGPMGNGVGQSINGILFTAPDLKPYEVVYNTLVKAKNRIAAVDGYKSKVRPYLQDFTASYLYEGYYQKYGAEQVRQQIQAVYDAGYEEWILWSGANNYSWGAFKKK